MRLDKLDTKYCVYVELDALLDTRLALLEYLIPSELDEYLKNDKYWKRSKDNLANIPADEFNAIYKHRNKKLLLKARPTGVIDMLRDLFLEMNFSTDAMIAKEDEHARMYINSYPYKLTDIDIENLTRLYSSEYGDKIEIVFMHMSPSNLTPQWVLEHVNTLVMYHGLQWLNAHMAKGNVFKSMIVDRLLITPFILPTTCSCYNVADNIRDNLTQMVAPFITLQFMPSEVFSSDLKYSIYEKFVQQMKEKK